MNNTPLKDLDWFSFTSDLNKLRHLSISQAIAYILRNEEDLKSLGKEYEQSIHRKEIIMAKVVDYKYGETTDQHSARTTNNEFDYTNICIPKSKVPGNEFLTYLRSSRTQVIDSMGAPISTIYSLLQAEIHKYTSKEDTALKIKKKIIGGFDNFYFEKKDILNWKSLNTIKELGLLDANLNTTLKTRADKVENHEKITGMLIYLLANQPLYEYGKNVDFTKGSDVTNINSRGIYNYFKDEFLYEDELSDEDKASDKRPRRSFPSENTVTEYLEKTFRLFRNDVDFKIKT